MMLVHRPPITVGSKQSPALSPPLRGLVMMMMMMMMMMMIIISPFGQLGLQALNNDKLSE
jgi:hypothetical protein